MKPQTPIPGSSLDNTSLVEYKFRQFLLEVDTTQISPEWLFNPQAWINVSSHLRKNDLIRILAKDGSYDFWAKVNGKTTGGKLAARISIYSGYGDGLPDYVKEAEKASTATALVPMVIGGKIVPRVEHVEIDGWRVIGFDSTVHSKGYESEVQARRAMKEYVDVFGFKSVADGPAIDAKTGELHDITPKVAPAPPKPDTAETEMLLNNLSFQKRKEVEQKAKKDAEKKAELERLAQRKRDLDAAREAAT